MSIKHFISTLILRSISLKHFSRESKTPIYFISPKEKNNTAFFVSQTLKCELQGTSEGREKRE